MHLERRQAIALAAGIAMAVGTSKEALACSRRPPPAFRPTNAEQDLMATQLDSLRRCWNDGKPDSFLEKHCIERAQLNYVVDGKGGNWADAAAAIQIFHRRYPRMISEFSGIMFDPLLPFLYAVAEFEEAPKVPVENEEITLCARAGMVPTFVIQMRFVESYYHGADRLPAEQPIVAQLSFREHGSLASWFQKNA
jgi:hypothetical protein